ncbi:MAG: DUF1549 domain-containing protein, partial [Armatimonadetes bacterium]|nr:DUF1549 domain-containing protein [Armatimonadota bacterium]
MDLSLPFMHVSSHSCALLAALVPVALAAAALAAPDGSRRAGPDFNREVRPILTRHCFKCHGPDDKQRQAGLRLDLRAGAIAVSRSRRRAVVPGRPTASELLRRTNGHAGSPGVMPPAAVQNPLTGTQKEILRRWVAAGARYDTHWSFVPPRVVPLPRVRKQGWVRNPVDAFVLARLEQEGLAPSPEAERATLVRRVYLDLIGLPPTPAEADLFLQDTSPDAYERLVDRLLASRHYGERWARRWLDLARYADTNGYEKDRPRSVWPYRDWVIQALNADMPFHQFTIEQLAGDMLPGATLAQRIATGFHRNTMLNEEGGIDPLEFRFHAMTDRVAVTGATWLGLTLGCAQCHTHKYDPIPQQEYYRFFAFLNNADEPELDVPQSDVVARRAETEARIAALTAALPEKFPAAPGLSPQQNLARRRREWMREQAEKTSRWFLLKPEGARANLPLLTVDAEGTVWSSGDQSKRDVYDITIRVNQPGVTALRLEALADDRLPKHGPGRVYYEGPHGDFFLSEITLTSGGRKWPVARATHSFAAGPGAPAALDGNPQTGWSVNGGQGKAHHAVFRLGEPLPVNQPVTVQLLFERYYACGMGKFRIWATTDPTPGDAGPLSPALQAALLKPEAERTQGEQQDLATAFLEQAPELKEARDAIQKLRGEVPALPTALVLEERPPENPRATYVHRRGEFLQPGEVVTPGLLSSLTPASAGAPRDRLAFARWLASDRNPLIGRVTVNRHWAALFGRGLVRTTEDFGFQGELPSHPELLDWLAAMFTRESGLNWSVKALHRLLVTSATYRQTSRTTPVLAGKDPQNRLLARGPRVRLEAELIRDAALKISGLLSPRVGGPSVFPPQPAGVTAEGTYGPLQWKVSEGEDRYRRGLYTFAKRTAPYAMFLT